MEKNAIKFYSDRIHSISNRKSMERRKSLEKPHERKRSRSRHYKDYERQRSTSKDFGNYRSSHSHSHKRKHLEGFYSYKTESDRFYADKRSSKSAKNLTFAQKSIKNHSKEKFRKHEKHQKLREKKHKGKRSNDAKEIIENKATKTSANETAKKLIAFMKSAYIQDRNSVLHGQPGVMQLDLLENVTHMMMKKDMRSVLIKYNFFGILKCWLSPLADGNLPCYQVRSRILKKLWQNFTTVDAKVILESGIGKAIYCLLHHPKEMKENRKYAQNIINEWFQTIIASKFNFVGFAKDDTKYKRREVEKEKEKSKSKRKEKLKAESKLKAKLKEKLKVEQTAECKSTSMKVKPNDDEVSETASLKAKKRT